MFHIFLLLLLLLWQAVVVAWLASWLAGSSLLDNRPKSGKMAKKHLSRRRRRQWQLSLPLHPHSPTLTHHYSTIVMFRHWQMYNLWQ